MMPSDEPEKHVAPLRGSAWLGSIDIATMLLAFLPWQISPLLGGSGFTYAFFRLQARANERSASMVPALTFWLLLTVWLVLSGWAVPLLLVASATALIFLIRKFVRDNAQTWKESNRAILCTALLRTLTFTGVIFVLLLPGIVAGLFTHKLAALCVAQVDTVPTRDLDKYFPKTVPPPWYHFGDYLVYECDPRRLLMGEIRDGLITRPKLNEAPRQLTQVTRVAYRCLDLAWWMFVVYTCYVAFRLYLYVFARTFVASGGRAVVQLEQTK